MSDRRRVLFLIVIMTIVAGSAATIATVALYDAAFQEERERLVVTVQSQARLIESIARNERLEEGKVGAGHVSVIDDTLSQVRDAHEQYVGFGETGELALAGLEGDSIVFLLSHRHGGLEAPSPIPVSSQLAEPMRRALSEGSGTIVGLDYRGVTVLAAYEPVAELDLGIVAKIDLAEIRAPFIRAGLLSAAGAAILIGLGTLSFLRVTNPMLRHLAESEKKYRTIFEGMRDIFFRLDLEGRLIEISPSIERSTGYAPEEYLTLSAEERYPDVEERERLIQEIISKGEVHDRLMARNTKSGDVAQTSVTAHLRRDASGEPEGIEGIARDISRRARAEEELRDLNVHLEQRVAEATAEMKEATEELRNIFESSVDMLAVASFDGHFIKINPSFERVLGYSDEEFLARPFFHFIHPDDVAATQEVIEEKLRQGVEVMSFENRYRCKDGSYKWIMWTSHPVPEQGLIYADGRDMTRERQASEELEKHRNHLEELVAKRTSEIKGTSDELRRKIAEQTLSEKKLQESRLRLRKLAARLHAVREEERTAVSREIHDELGQALTSVRIDVDWLERALPEGEESARERARSIRSLVDETLVTVRDLASRLRPPVLDDLGLDAAIEWQANEFASRTGIECRLDLEAQEDRLDDELATAVFRVLQEALTNITRHADARLVRISLQTRDEDLMLEVADDGKGISEEEASSDDALGLIGMRERAEFLGGSLEIAEGVSGGVVVTLRMPMPRAETSDEATTP